MTSVNSYEEIGGGNKEATHHVAVDVNQVTSQVYAKSRAAKCAEKFLSIRMRRVLRHWRKETELYLGEMRFRLRN